MAAKVWGGCRRVAPEFEDRKPWINSEQLQAPSFHFCARKTRKRNIYVFAAPHTTSSNPSGCFVSDVSFENSDRAQIFELRLRNFLPELSLISDHFSSILHFAIQMSSLSSSLSLRSYSFCVAWWIAPNISYVAARDIWVEIEFEAICLLLEADSSYC